MMLPEPTVSSRGSRHKVVVLMSLWGELCPQGTTKERKYARLRFLAQTVGRIVDSANDLTDDELERAIQSLHQLRQSRARQQAVHKNVRRMPNRSGISSRELWKIRQLETYLGWANVPQRLTGFLEHVYKVSRPDHLTHAQAWRCIESLFDLAARAAIKAEKGSTYRVPKPELAASAAALKDTLRSWSLPEQR